MKHSINDQLQYNPDQKSIKVLFQANAKVIGLAFKANQMLEKHKTNTAAFLFVVSGEVEFMISNETYTLKASEYFEIPVDVEHEVRAVVDSKLLLIK